MCFAAGALVDMEGMILFACIHFNNVKSKTKVVHITVCLFPRLGHREQKDEWQPRLVEVFQRHNVLPANAIVSAGSASSACTAGIARLALMHNLFLSS